MKLLGHPEEYQRGWVRPVPESYGQQLERPERVDLDRARRQHERYCDILEEVGLKVEYLPSADDHPDAVFVEDPAVLASRRTLVTTLQGDRQGEHQGLLEYFSSTRQLLQMPHPALLEGGDVLHLPDQTFVGRSQRTNREGIQQLRAFLPARRSLEVLPVHHALHLKTVVTHLGGRTVWLDPERTNSRFFQDYEVLTTPSGEGKAANVLRVQDAVLVPASYPKSIKKLEKWTDAHGLRLYPVAMTEFESAGGGLTCLSLRE